jgi:hypothetical protein
MTVVQLTILKFQNALKASDRKSREWLTMVGIFSGTFFNYRQKCLKSDLSEFKTSWAGHALSFELVRFFVGLIS